MEGIFVVSCIKKIHICDGFPNLLLKSLEYKSPTLVCSIPSSLRLQMKQKFYNVEWWCTSCEECLIYIILVATNLLPDLLPCAWLGCHQVHPNIKHLIKSLNRYFFPDFYYLIINMFWNVYDFSFSSRCLD